MKSHPPRSKHHLRGKEIADLVTEVDIRGVYLFLNIFRQGLSISRLESEFRRGALDVRVYLHKNWRGPPTE